jgi:hypothetical protein
VESLVTGMVDQVNAQMKALRDQAQLGESMAAGPLAAQNAAYLQLSRDWMDAFTGMLGGAPAKRTDADGEDEKGR